MPLCCCFSSEEEAAIAKAQMQKRFAPHFANLQQPRESKVRIVELVSGAPTPDTGPAPSPLGNPPHPASSKSIPVIDTTRRGTPALALHAHAPGLPRKAYLVSSAQLRLSRRAECRSTLLDFHPRYVHVRCPTFPMCKESYVYFSTLKSYNQLSAVLRHRT